jgi:hypothetical protein
MSPEIKLRLYDLGLIERRECQTAHCGAQTWATGMFGAVPSCLVNVCAAAVPSSVAASPSPHLIAPTEAGSRLRHMTLDDAIATL